MSGWQPIATAPTKRNSVIIGMGKRTEHSDSWVREYCWVMDLWWCESEPTGWFDTKDYEGPYDPQYWMPCPRSEDMP